MILNGNDIKKLVEEKDLINPFTVDNVNSGSYDISVSSTILKIKKSFKVIDLNNSEQISKMYEEVDIKNKKYQHNNYYNYRCYAYRIINIHAIK